MFFKSINVFALVATATSVFDSFASAAVYEATLHSVATPDGPAAPCGTSTASGYALHLGEFTETGVYCFGAPNDEGFAEISGQVWQVSTANPADSLCITNQAMANLAVDPIETIGASWHACGGTGKFQDVTAMGTFTTDATPQDNGSFLLDVTVSGNIYGIKECTKFCGKDKDDKVVSFSNSSD